MNTTPTSLKQAAKMLEQLGDPSSELMQYLLGSGLLADFRDCIGPHLKQVDRVAHRALLAPPPKQIDWTPVVEYADKLRDWNKRFDLGLTEAQIDQLARNLPDHAGPHLPTGIRLTLGRGLENDREVVRQIIAYELDKLGMSFTDELEDVKLLSFLGSESKSETLQLDVVLLRLTEGDVYYKRRWSKSYEDKPLPALEVYWLMALNPQVLAAIDGETVPFIWAPGFDVSGDNPAVFVRYESSDKKAFVTYGLQVLFMSQQYLNMVVQVR